METWVIFAMWLLINWVVNVAETFTNILEYYVLHTNATKLENCRL